MDESEEKLYCTYIKELPHELHEEAAYRAIDICPVNAPRGVHPPERIAVLTQKFWGARATDLTIGFMEQVSQTVQQKVLSHANSWNEFAKVRFRLAAQGEQAIVRISFGSGGYYSYLGPDCLSIPSNQHTMNLERFDRGMPESEWTRVVRHEFGHVLGCPHEQQRQAIENLLDEQKVINYFMRTQGWSEREVRQQILIPLQEASLMGASPADQLSIMCYSFPGSVTKSGQPIPGGNDFSIVDRTYFAKIYPLDVQPPLPPQPPIPPTGDRVATTMQILDQAGIMLASYAIKRTD